MPAEPTTSLDLLLTHEAFVRATARAVLRGDAEVEDVVQETWLTAMRRGPREGGALRRWLGRVARNLAIDAWRRRSRRQRHEGAAARPEALPSVADIAEREEARRRLVEAVLALEEPSRSAVLLRYYEGLSVRDVARRLDVPMETVRTRLRRGLDRLRGGRGAGRGGGTRAWGLALLPWADARPSRAIGRWALGGLAMKKTIGVVAAAGVVLAAGYAVLRPELGPSRDDRTAATAPREAQGASAGAMAPGPAPVGPTLASTPKAPREAPADLPYASGVVIDRGGHPVPGVAVLSRAMESQGGFAPQEQGFEFHRRIAEPTTRTDAEGRFEVASATKDQVSLVFLKGGFAPAEVRGLDPAAAKNQGLRVVLDAGERFEVRVEDTDGRPVEGARLIFWFRPDAQAHTLFGGHTTDADGRCVVDWLPPGDSPIQQVFVGGYAYEEKLLRGADLHAEEKVVLRRKMPLVVLRNAAGGPVPPSAGGLVHSEGTEPRFVAVLTETPMRQDWAVPIAGLLAPTPWPPHADGQDAKEGSYRASVFASGFLPAEASFRVVAGTEPPRVEIAMAAGEAPVALAGTVEPRGVESFEVRTAMPKGYGAEGDLGLPLLFRVPVSPSGAFVVRGLPDGPYRLVVSAPGLAPVGRDVLAPDEKIRLALEAGATLDVRVVGEDGAPVANRPVAVGVDGVRLSWDATTGADGVARFEGLPAGLAHAIPFATQGMAFSTLPPHATTPLVAGERRSLDVRVPSRVRTTFRVRDERGAPVAGVEVSVQIRRGWAVLVGGEWELLKRRTVTTSADGTVTVDLYEGEYEAKASLGPVERTTLARVASQPGTVDLAWTTSGATVFGRVTETGGAPVAGRSVRVALATPDARGWVGQGVTDADGRYEVGGLPAQPLTVRYALPSLSDGRRDPDSPYPTATWDVTPEAGERRRHDVLVPRVRGEGAEEPGVDASIAASEVGSSAPLAGVTALPEARRGDTWVECASMRTGADGRATGRLLRGERYRFRLYRSAGNALTHALKTIEATPVGEGVQVEAVLERVPPSDR
jgi:RNA polymerase sigma-70 factor (ECF subfamily)